MDKKNGGEGKAFSARGVSRMGFLVAVPQTLTHGGRFDKTWERALKGMK